MAKNGDWDSIYPFIFVIIFYVISLVNKAKKKEKSTSVQVPRARPVFHTPPKAPSQVSSRPIAVQAVSRKKVELPKNERATLSNHSPKPRIASLVESLPSKKTLVLLSEVLNNRCF